ncbi:hypothetical protein C0991_006930 [Blastosporella zonata]|nr:hypothetical protein C0991_006930 [Blastosporella zonata]
MTGSGNTLFWGDNAHNENAQDFFKSFNYAMGSKDNAHKRRQFMYCLHSGGAAEVWYTGLPEDTKANWSLVEAAFNARWPPVKIAAKLTEEFEGELLGCVLLEEVLGLKECVADREVWSHIAWADRIGILAAGADILGSKTYIGQVKKTLPGVVRDKLADSYANWTAFLDDVRGIDIEYIKGKAEDARKLLETVALHVHQMDRTTTAAATAPGRRFANITNEVSPANTTVYNRGRPPTSSNTNANINANTNTKGPGRVVTAADRAAFKGQYNLLPHHPPTDAGRLAHQAQQKAWFDANPSGIVTEMTPYPLRPGTAAVNSSECFKCGLFGHISGYCTTTRPLLPNEQRWRAICANMLREPRAAAPVGVRLVVIDDYGTTMEVQGGGGDEGQGKEEGPST